MLQAGQTRLMAHVQTECRIKSAESNWGDGISPNLTENEYSNEYVCPFSNKDFELNVVYEESETLAQAKLCEDNSHC